MAASRFDSDDGRSSTVNDRSPSPLSTSQGSADVQYTNSFFAPVSRLASIDSDVHMTDATNGTADTSAAARRDRFSSPVSTSTNATNGKKIGRGGAASAVPRRSGGGGSESRASPSLSLRGGSGRGTPATRGGSGGMAKPKPKPKAVSANQGRFANSRARSSASPHVKREPDTDGDGDSDEADDDSNDGGAFKRRRTTARRRVLSDDDNNNGVDNGVDNDDDDNDDNEDNGSMEGEVNASDDNGPYCICRGPDDHRWMIQCDDCEDWYHGDCVDINKEDGETMILSYICPICTIPGRYMTRFRRLCSYASCRKAARLYGDDGTLAPDANHFCSDAHRDQWWDALLSRMGRARPVTAAEEAKLAVDQLTPAQLITVLSHTDEPGVAQILLNGLSQDSDVDLDAVLTKEERETTQESAVDRARFAEQIEMCKKMLQLLDMAKSRHQEAVKAGHMERDACGYDERLQHVGVQPHFERFLTSPEGTAIFHSDSETLSAPQFDDDGNAVDSRAAGRPAHADGGGSNAGEESDDGDDPEVAAATAGMCAKRKCKAHSSWFSTLARDVRMQIQELTRQIAMLLDNETRIRVAAVQRSFILQHSSSEVRFVDDSDNSLASLASDDEDDGRGGAAADAEAEAEAEAGEDEMLHAGAPKHNGHSQPAQANGFSGHGYVSPAPDDYIDVGTLQDGRSLNIDGAGDD